MTHIYDWKCSACEWPERCEGDPFGLDRPRCPWVWCDNFGLLMQAKSLLPIFERVNG